MTPTMNEEEEDQERPNAEVARVAMKLPPFWRSDPEFWFLQAESNFQLCNITSDSTKFCHIVSSLSAEYSQHVKPIVRNPPASGKYEAIKTALIKAYAESDESKLRKLLSDATLDVDKPSHLLHKMRDLGGTECSDTVIGQLWLQRLPSHVQQILAVAPDDLDQRAILADKVSEVNTQQIAAVSTPSPDIPDSSSQELLQAIASISQRLDAIEFQNGGRSSRRSSSRQRFSSRQPDTSPALCWYHKKFGSQAKKCTQPCTWSEAPNYVSGPARQRSSPVLAP